eukprot:scaffold4052_cov213-Amphora_coffeaeformis.AAC.4
MDGWMDGPPFAFLMGSHRYGMVDSRSTTKELQMHFDWFIDHQCLSRHHCSSVALPEVGGGSDRIGSHHQSTTNQKGFYYTIPYHTIPYDTHTHTHKKERDRRSKHQTN